MWKLMLICIAASAFSVNGEPEPVRTRATKKRSAGYSGSSSGSYSGSSAPRSGYSGTGGYVGSSIGSGGSYAGGSAGGFASSSAGSSAGGYAGSGTGAGSYAGGGGYGGYAGGSYSYDDYDDNFYAPNFGPGFIDPYVFHQQLTSQILRQNAATQNAIASTYTTGAGTGSAEASLLPDDPRIQNQIAQQQYYNNRQHLYNRGSSGHRYAPSYAAASGSTGPGGSYQSAHISPENPNTPNFSNRFSPSSSSGSGGGYKGVSVSSYSSSSDVNGQRTSQRGAQTTINDNGKVTSYSVHS